MIALAARSSAGRAASIAPARKSATPPAQDFQETPDRTPMPKALRRAAIVALVRTPVARFLGALAQVPVETPPRPSSGK